jgi:hypothetical protein
MKTTKKRLTLDDWNDLESWEQAIFLTLIKSTGHSTLELPDIADMIDYHTFLRKSFHKDAQPADDYYNNLIQGDEFVVGFQGLGGEGEQFIDLLSYECRQELKRFRAIHLYKTCAKCYPTA